MKPLTVLSLRRVVAATTKRKEGAVSIFRRLSHTLWRCQYHVVWVPKYRFRILTKAWKVVSVTFEYVKRRHLPIVRYAELMIARLMIPNSSSIFDKLCCVCKVG